jgi:GNAT superfamily N-acetyltransferase
VHVRTAAPGDTDAVSAVFLASRAAAVPWLPRLHTDGETRWWVEHVVLAGCLTWVAVDGDEVLGFAALRDDVLEHLYLRPDVRRQGIGTRLLDHAREASPAGLRLRVFTRNTAARGFYEACGFRVRSSGSDNEEREPDLSYGWTP